MSADHSSNENETQAETPSEATNDNGGTQLLLEQITKLQEELAAAKDQTIRARADLENYRKKTLREKEELRQRTQSSIIEDILPVIDNFRLGMDAAKNHDSAEDIVAGLGMVLQQLEHFLTQNGITSINPISENFDPQLHDCVQHAPSDEHAEGIVMQVTRIGYQMGTRLLRPASVVVSSGTNTNE